MENKHLIADIPQKAIIEHDGKVLLIKPINKQKWEIPGGRLDEGESPVAGIQREIKEELGLDIEPIEIVDTFVLLEEEPPNHFTLVWSAKLLSSTGDFKKQDDEIQDAIWVSENEVENLVFYKEHKNGLKKYFHRRKID